MFRLVAGIHFSDIGNLYWENLQRHAPCHIVTTSVNRASAIFSFASSLIYIPIGCRHPFIKYWQPLLIKTTATSCLPHPGNERQRSINSFSCCMFSNQVMELIIALITESLTAIIGKIQYTKGITLIPN
jgi:hypothetical protein